MNQPHNNIELINKKHTMASRAERYKILVPYKAIAKEKIYTALILNDIYVSYLQNLPIRVGWNKTKTFGDKIKNEHSNKKKP